MEATPALPTSGGNGGSAQVGSPARRSLCAVIAGALAIGTCLHLLAAVTALVVGIVMITIALTGDLAGWVGLGAAAALVAGAIGAGVSRLQR